MIVISFRALNLSTSLSSPVCFSAPFFKIIVPTVDTVRYQTIVAALLDAGHPALLTGPVGTGKTSTAQSVLQSLDLSRYAVLVVNMSAQVSYYLNRERAGTT